jgi:hypothetical protein
MHRKKNKNLSVIYFKQGLFAGIASSVSILTYPLEVLKIRYQVLESKLMTKNLIKKMYKEEGLRSFFRGVSQNMLHGFFGYGTVFYFYELFYYILNNYNKKNRALNSIISSTSAGIIAVIIVSPINYVKTRQILYKENKASINGNILNKTMSMFYILKDIYSEKKSIIGFWKALNPSIITSFYSAIQITLYQVLKDKYTSFDSTNLKLNSFFGLISRSIACTIIYPFTLLRSRILNFQNEKLVEGLDRTRLFYTSQIKYGKIFKDLNTIIKNEGLSPLFRGLQFDIVKVSINGALFFYCYEFLKNKYILINNM